jgi:hypothetical protein
MIRTREEELQDSLVGCTVEEVRVVETTGGPTALIRMSRTGAEDIVASFDADSFSDADAIWRTLG